jgi:hypothetical protein
MGHYEMSLFSSSRVRTNCVLPKSTKNSHNLFTGTFYGLETVLGIYRAKKTVIAYVLPYSINEVNLSRYSQREPRDISWSSEVSGHGHYEMSLLSPNLPLSDYST